MRGLGPTWKRLSVSSMVVGIAAACGDDPPNDRAMTGADDAGAASTDASSTTDGATPGAEDAASDAGDSGLLSPAFVYRDINHILSTGQSLSVGAVGTPPLTLAQPYANVMFSSGAIAGGTNLTALAPLFEGRVDGGSNPDVETMSSGLANLVTRMAREELLVGEPAGKTSHDLLVSVHGVGGTAYVGLKKGTAAYTNGIAQARAAFDLAQAQNKSYVVRAVTNVHGESDHVAGNAGYQQNLVEWQSDYETDVRAITGQAEPIPMFHTQMSSWTKFNATTSAIPQAQLAASIASNGKIVLVGPKYHLPYVGDGVHLTNEGYRHMGEDYAKVYRRVILEGRPWEPVRPIQITRSAATVTVKFAVPAPPLVLDSTLVTNPGGFGFEFTQTGGNTITVANVTVTGPDTVAILLSAEPTGTAQRLRYAFTAPNGSAAGPMTGPRGNLRDSDATVSRHGYALYNWCVHFDEPMP